MSVKVFYAWQSDSDQDTTRFLIRDAIKASLKKLNADLKMQEAPSFEIDHDTRGEPGTPQIAETIARKIRRCGVFVADVTLVTKYTTGNRRRKWTPNPNVMIELGLAIRNPGWRQILLVQNAAYGSAEGLPFDLKHRSFPIQYTLKPGASKEETRAAMDDLVKAMTAKLKTIVEEVLISMNEEARAKHATAAAQQRKMAEEKWKAFDERLQSNQFPGLHGVRSLVEHVGSTLYDRDGFVSMSVVPLIPASPLLNMRAVKEGGGHDLRPIGNDSWSTDAYGKSVVCFDGGRKPDGSPLKPTSVVEVTNEGSVLVAAVMSLHRKQTNGERVYLLEGEEKQLLVRLAGYVRLLRRFGVVGPLEVRVRFIGIGRSYLLPSNLNKLFRTTARLNEKDTVTLDPAVIPANEDGSSIPAVAAVMRDSFSIIWQDLGMEDPCFDESGNLQMAVPG